MTCGNTVGPSAGIQQNVEGFVRRINFEPGYDCIAHHGDAYARCHGRGGMRLRFLLTGEEGAVQFLMSCSDWLPGSLDSIGSTRRDKALFGVSGSDLGHHWTRPVYTGESVMDGECEYLHGAQCFYDGSGLNATGVLDRLLRDGLDGVWEELEEYYRYCSEGADEAAKEAAEIGSDVVRPEPIESNRTLGGSDV